LLHQTGRLRGNAHEHIFEVAHHVDIRQSAALDEWVDDGGRVSTSAIRAPTPCYSDAMSAALAAFAFLLASQAPTTEPAAAVDR
jgi:hypothetical protein